MPLVQGTSLGPITNAERKRRREEVEKKARAARQQMKVPKDAEGRAQGVGNAYFNKTGKLPSPEKTVEFVRALSQAKLDTQADYDDLFPDWVQELPEDPDDLPSPTHIMPRDRLSLKKVIEKKTVGAQSAEWDEKGYGLAQHYAGRPDAKLWDPAFGDIDPVDAIQMFPHSAASNFYSQEAARTRAAKLAGINADPMMDLAPVMKVRDRVYGKAAKNIKDRRDREMLWDIITMLDSLYPDEGIAESYGNDLRNVKWDDTMDYFVARYVLEGNLCHVLLYDAMPEAKRTPAMEKRRDAAKSLINSVIGSIEEGDDLYAMIQALGITNDEDTPVQVTDQYAEYLFYGFSNARKSQWSDRQTIWQYAKLFGAEFLPAEQRYQYETEMKDWNDAMAQAELMVGLPMEYVDKDRPEASKWLYAFASRMSGLGQPSEAELADISNLVWNEDSPLSEVVRDPNAKTGLSGKVPQGRIQSDTIFNLELAEIEKAGGPKAGDLHEAILYIAPRVLDIQENIVEKQGPFGKYEQAFVQTYLAGMYLAEAMPDSFRVAAQWGSNPFTTMVVGDDLTEQEKRAHGAGGPNIQIEGDISAANLAQAWKAAGETLNEYDTHAERETAYMRTVWNRRGWNPEDHETLFFLNNLYWSIAKDVTLDAGMTGVWRSGTNAATKIVRAATSARNAERLAEAERALEAAQSAYARTVANITIDPDKATVLPKYAEDALSTLRKAEEEVAYHSRPLWHDTTAMALAKGTQDPVSLYEFFRLKVGGERFDDTTKAMLQLVEDIGESRDAVEITRKLTKLNFEHGQRIDPGPLFWRRAREIDLARNGSFLTPGMKFAISRTGRFSPVYDDLIDTLDRNWQVMNGGYAKTAKGYTDAAEALKVYRQRAWELMKTARSQSEYSLGAQKLFSEMEAVVKGNLKARKLVGGIRKTANKYAKLSGLNKTLDTYWDLYQLQNYLATSASTRGKILARLRRGRMYDPRISGYDELGEAIVKERSTVEAARGEMKTLTSEIRNAKKALRTIQKMALNGDATPEDVRAGKQALANLQAAKKGLKARKAGENATPFLERQLAQHVYMELDPLKVAAANSGRWRNVLEALQGTGMFHGHGPTINGMIGLFRFVALARMGFVITALGIDELWRPENLRGLTSRVLAHDKNAAARKMLVQRGYFRDGEVDELTELMSNFDSWTAYTTNSRDYHTLLNAEIAQLQHPHETAMNVLRELGERQTKPDGTLETMEEYIGRFRQGMRERILADTPEAEELRLNLIQMRRMNEGTWMPADELKRLQQEKQVALDEANLLVDDLVEQFTDVSSRRKLLSQQLGKPGQPSKEFTARWLRARFGDEAAAVPERPPAAAAAPKEPAAVLGDEVAENVLEKGDQVQFLARDEFGELTGGVRTGRVYDIEDGIAVVVKADDNKEILRINPAELDEAGKPGFKGIGKAEGKAPFRERRTGPRMGEEMRGTADEAKPFIDDVYERLGVKSAGPYQKYLTDEATGTDVFIDLQEAENGVIEINSIRADVAGQKAGQNVLGRICDMADERGVTLRIPEAKPFGKNPMEKEKLEAIYERFEFRVVSRGRDDIAKMERPPQGVADEAVEQADTGLRMTDDEEMDALLGGVSDEPKAAPSATPEDQINKLRAKRQEVYESLEASGYEAEAAAAAADPYQNIRQIFETIMEEGGIRAFYRDAVGNWVPDTYTDSALSLAELKQQYRHLLTPFNPKTKAPRMPKGAGANAPVPGRSMDDMLYNVLKPQFPETFNDMDVNDFWEWLQNLPADARPRPSFYKKMENQRVARDTLRGGAKLNADLDAIDRMLLKMADGQRLDADERKMLTEFIGEDYIKPPKKKNLIEGGQLGPEDELPSWVSDPDRLIRGGEATGELPDWVNQEGIADVIRKYRHRLTADERSALWRDWRRFRAQQSGQEAQLDELEALIQEEKLVGDRLKDAKNRAKIAQMLTRDDLGSQVLTPAVEDWIDEWLEKIGVWMQDDELFDAYLHGKKLSKKQIRAIEARVKEKGGEMPVVVGASAHTDWGVNLPVLGPLAEKAGIGPFWWLEQGSEFIRRGTLLHYFRAEYDRLIGLGFEQERAIGRAWAHASDVAKNASYAHNMTGFEYATRNIFLFQPAYRQAVTYWAKLAARHPALSQGLWKNLREDYPAIHLGPISMFAPLPFWLQENFSDMAIPGFSPFVVLPAKGINMATGWSEVEPGQWEYTGATELDDKLEQIPGMTFAGKGTSATFQLDDILWGFFPEVVTPDPQSSRLMTVVHSMTWMAFFKDPVKRNRLANNIARAQLSKGLANDPDAAMEELRKDDILWRIASMGGIVKNPEAIIGMASRMFNPLGRVSYMPEELDSGEKWYQKLWGEDVRTMTDFYFRLSECYGDKEKMAELYEEFPKAKAIKDYYSMDYEERIEYLSRPDNLWIVPYVVGRNDYKNGRPLIGGEYWLKQQNDMIINRPLYGDNGYLKQIERFKANLDWSKTRERIETDTEKAMANAWKVAQAAIKKYAKTEEQAKQWRTDYEFYKNGWVDNTKAGEYDSGQRPVPFWLDRYVREKGITDVMKWNVEAIQNRQYQAFKAEGYFFTDDGIRAVEERKKEGDITPYDEGLKDWYLNDVWRATDDYEYRTGAIHRVTDAMKKYASPEYRRLFDWQESVSAPAIEEAIEKRKSYQRRILKDILTNEHWKLSNPGQQLASIGMDIDINAVNDLYVELDGLYALYQKKAKPYAQMSSEWKEVRAWYIAERNKLYKRNGGELWRDGIAGRILQSELVNGPDEQKVPQSYLDAVVKSMNRDEPDFLKIANAYRDHSIDPSDFWVVNQKKMRRAAWATVAAVGADYRKQMLDTWNDAMGSRGISPAANAAEPYRRKLTALVNMWRSISSQFSEEWDEYMGEDIDNGVYMLLDANR